MREQLVYSRPEAEMDDELSESPVASPSPENNSNATERDERRRNGERNGSIINRGTDFRWRGRRISCVMLSLVLCALVVIIAPHINGDWSLKGFQEGKTNQQ